MSEKHTPGPWERYGTIGQIGLSKVRAVVGTDRTNRNIFVEIPHTPADAKLVASAPDLLAKIKRLTAELEQEVALREEAEEAADEMAANILNEPIDWSDHSAKWEEAIAKAQPQGER